MNSQKKLVQARTELVLDPHTVFFASLALRLELVEDASIDTMAVDGKSILYNPQFVDSLSMPELRGVLCHEVMHVALCHHLRRGSREPKKWNVAADYAINPTILDCGMKLPKDALFDVKYRNWSAEKIYDHLPDQTGKGDDPGKCGGVRDAKDGQGQALSDAAKEQAAEEVRVSVMQAAQNAKGQGLVPGALQEIIEGFKHPQHDWKEILRRFMAQVQPSDYSWSRPNRRFIHQGVYLPGIVKEGIGEIVIAIDTSGSLDEQALASFANEINSIIGEVKPERVHVLYCDTRVHRADSYEEGDELRFNAVGRGGTDFRPPFEWVMDEGLEPKALLYFTDLMGPFPSDPGYPVLWISTNPNGKAPFGETIYL